MSARPSTLMETSPAPIESVEGLLGRAVVAAAREFNCDCHTAAAFIGKALLEAAATPKPTAH